MFHVCMQNKFAVKIILRLSRTGSERSFVCTFFNLIPLCISPSSAPLSFCSRLFNFGLSVLASAIVGGGGGAGGGGGGIYHVNKM